MNARALEETGRAETSSPVRVTVMVAARPEDIPAHFATAAFSATSHTPDKSGQRCRLDYAEWFNSLRDELLGRAPEDTDLSMLMAELEAFRLKFLAAYKAWLSAHGRCMSSFIVGPAKFPVAKAEKANRTERKRLEELIELKEKGRARLLRLITPESERAISSDDPNAAQKLETRAQEQLSELERMKQVNKLYRAARRKSDDDAAALLAIKDQLSKEELRDVLSNMSHGLGDCPYPEWAIRNARQRAKATQARATVIERKAQDETQEWEGSAAKVVDNVEENRVQLHFPGKPEEEVRRRLRSSAFKWAPSVGAWQRHRSYQALAEAKRIAGVPE